MADTYAVLICDNVPNAVVLTHSGPHAIAVVQVLRRWTGLGLWGSRLLLDRLPAAILDDVAQETAEAAVRELLVVARADLAGIRGRLPWGTSG
ncbi:ribosomal protein L7/L12 [Kitasatospora griseola]|uniref:ribosomal protein L7/L12 n=1 Tax=Kitasatospora griseola TaxID=2064 RepID=UPI003810721C